MAQFSYEVVVICVIMDNVPLIIPAHIVHCMSEASSDCKNAEMEREGKREWEAEGGSTMGWEEGKQMLVPV